jgi:hypothetical protein
MRLAFALVLLMLGSPGLTGSHAADTKPPSAATADQAAPAGRVPDAGRGHSDRPTSPAGDHQDLGVPKTLTDRTATFSFPEWIGWPIVGALLGTAAALGVLTVMRVKSDPARRPREAA